MTTWASLRTVPSETPSSIAVQRWVLNPRQRLSRPLAGPTAAEDIW